MRASGMVVALSFAGLAAHASAQASELSVPTPPSYSTLPTTEPHASDRAHVVEAWLRHYADAAQGQRMLGGVVNVIVGPGVAAGEIALIASSNSDGVRAIGAVGIAVGVLDLALGIYRLVAPSREERRFERWRIARDAETPMTGEDIARFEGELRGDVASAEQMRWEMLGVGIAFVAAGVAGAITTGVLARDDFGREMGYLVSGGVGLIGVVLATLPWLFTQPEDDWNRLTHGQLPLTAITPWLTPWGAGIGLSGAF